jgi:fatty acid/phospholipid biosynthesis enzyme
VMKVHGSARERAITNALRITTDNLHQHVNQTIAQEIARANERLVPAEALVPTSLPA